MNRQEKTPEQQETKTQTEIQNEKSPSNPNTVTLLDMVPDKFVNSETSQINWEELVKSYLALEKKLSSRPTSQTPINIPTSPNDYQIKIPNDLMKIDPEVNQRLFDLGCTNEQVQGIYDLAADKIIPLIQSLSLEFQTEKDLKELEQEFGGPEQFNTVARQISAWGEKNLDKSVFDLLASHKDGIIALYRMMNGNREANILPSTPNKPTDSEEVLRRLMQDPKYWKYQDPDLIKRIENGFKQLYG